MRVGSTVRQEGGWARCLKNLPFSFCPTTYQLLRPDQVTSPLHWPLNFMSTSRAQMSTSATLTARTTSTSGDQDAGSNMEMEPPETPGLGARTGLTSSRALPTPWHAGVGGSAKPKPRMSTGTKTRHLGRQEGSCRKECFLVKGATREVKRLTEQTHQGHCPHATSPARRPARWRQNCRHRKWTVHHRKDPQSSSYRQWPFVFIILCDSKRHLERSPVGMRNAAPAPSVEPWWAQTCSSQPPCTSSPPDGAAHQEGRDPIQDYKLSFWRENTVVNEERAQNKGKFIHRLHSCYYTNNNNTSGMQDNVAALQVKLSFWGSHDHQRPPIVPVSLGPGSVV